MKLKSLAMLALTGLCANSFAAAGMDMNAHMQPNKMLADTSSSQVAPPPMSASDMPSTTDNAGSTQDNPASNDDTMNSGSDTGNSGSDTGTGDDDY